MYLIGLSLSFCVQDMVEDNISTDDILYIISGTKIKTYEHLTEVIEQYGKSYWKGIEARSAEIVLELFEANKILQPRLINEDAISLSGPSIKYRNQRWLSTMDTKEAING